MTQGELIKKGRFSRRSALKAVVLSALAAVIQACTGTAGGGTGKKIVVDLTQAESSALQNAGGSVTLAGNTLDSIGLILYRASQNSISVYSRQCTHAGCPINEFQNGIASCPCHGSQFDVNGKPIQGPANQPLKQYKAILQGNEVTITDES